MNEDVQTARDIYYTIMGRHCEFKCSACGGELAELWFADGWDDFSFCPFCGRKLVDVEDGE